jgi:hypothetical protein
MVNLKPHPLVPEVVAGLIDGDVPLKRADELRGLLAHREVLLAAANAARRQYESEQAEAHPDAEQALDVVDLALASSLVESSDTPELVMFAGYLGGRVEKDDGTLWCVLYLDSRLLTWLLVQVTGVVYRDQRKDDKAACGLLDLIWVKADTSVKSGSGSQAVETQFLAGNFTRAGDVEAAPGGGTLEAATGVFCEARSPGCCQGCTVRRSR